jgi:hypothetical protein
LESLVGPPGFEAADKGDGTWKAAETASPFLN